MRRGIKSYRANVALKDKRYGYPQRVSYTQDIVDKAPIFPKPLEYADIDKAFFEFVDKQIPLSIDGKKVPTFTIFSNQRFSEYSQTWKHTDEDNNLLMNFKTISRDNNPKDGDNQGGYWNIPGDRRYTLLIRDIMEDNGTECYEIYSMKQPFAVDLTYNIGFITNKLEYINLFNQRINDLFKAHQAYIRPNDHYIPMVLQDISDETNTGVDDRKFYSQVVNINAMAYIIDSSSFKVERKPKRVRVMVEENDSSFSGVDIEESNNGKLQNCQVDININIGAYKDKIEFEMDSDAVIESYEMDNVRTMRISVNRTPIYYQKGFKLHLGDKVRVRVVPLLFDEPSVVKLHGYNPNATYVESETPELVTDEKPKFEEINVNSLEVESKSEQEEEPIDEASLE